MTVHIKDFKKPDNQRVVFGYENLRKPALGPQSTGHICTVHGLNPTLSVLLNHGAYVLICEDCAMENVDIGWAIDAQDDTQATNGH